MPRIFDNIEERLLPALTQTLDLCERADFCVGYFNMRGWSQLHDSIEKWSGGEGHCCRLLVGMQKLPQDQLRQLKGVSETGDPQMDQATALVLKKRIAQEFRDQLVIGIPTNADEAGLRRLAVQLAEKKVVVKLFLRHTLHAKLYLLFRPDPLNPAIGFLGSSNLTFSGLSKQGELNVDVMDHDACQKLSAWFEDRWTDKFCLDISNELIEIINTSWARPDTIPPYQIYVKMAYHLAQEARAGLTEFRIPSDFGNTLFDYQTAAVKIAAHHLNKRGGVMIGDVVGLGKTMMATALARVFEDDHGLETLIICPKNLVKMWDHYRQKYRLRATILPSTMAQQQLPRTVRHRLVLIDESHNLRNREGSRYRAIAEYIAANDSRVILLSATPYNKTYLDLANQLRLFIDESKDIGIRPERLLKDLGETEFIRRHQCPVRSLAAFEKSEHPDDWRELMRLYLVRRTRSFVKDNYAEFDEARNRKFLRFPDGRHSYFPDRIPRTITFDIDDQDPADAYAQMFDDSVVRVVDRLKLPRYGLGNYRCPSPPQLPTKAEVGTLDDLSRAGSRLKGFCRTNLFKRLESCGLAFILSVERHIFRNYIFMHALENNLPIPIGTQDIEGLDPEGDKDDDWWGAEDNDGEGIPETAERPVLTEDHLKRRAAQVYQAYERKYSRRFKWLKAELFTDELTSDLKKDAKALLKILQKVGSWSPARDAKLQALLKLLTVKHPKEKVLVFSQFADTVDYLATALEKAGLPSIAGVTGDHENPTSLVYRFSPDSNEQREFITREQELRVVVATDVLSEGQNLQDCHIVVNFDLPWAIIRLIQRAGRVDRIGQQADNILCYSFLPAEGVERIIKLRSRVRQRLQENAEVVGADETFFEDQDGDGVVRDLFTEKAGILDGDDDTEVDLASFAYQIWKNAIDKDPSLEKVIPALPDVVYSTKAWNRGAGVPPASPGKAGETPAPLSQNSHQDAESIAASSEPPLTLGSCMLRDAAIATIVRDALCHFDDQRYHLHAWCIMPNHVHVVVTPWGAHTLSEILHSWKSYTAHAINKQRGVRGEVWERESFDHLVRSSESLGRFIAYVDNNPVEAGLCSEPGKWPYSSTGAKCGAGVSPAASSGKEGRTPAPPPFHPPSSIDYSSMRSRGELPHLHKEGASYFVTFRLRDAVVSRGAGVPPATTKTSGISTATLREAGETPAPQPQPRPLDRRPEGALVYLRTAEGSDALAWVDKQGRSVTESQFAILKAAECGPETPSLDRHPDHHEMVAKGVKLIVETEKSVGGQLGRPSGARFRTYERLKAYAEKIKGELFDRPELRRAIDDIYKYPLLTTPTTPHSSPTVRKASPPVILIPSSISYRHENSRRTIAPAGQASR